MNPEQIREAAWVTRQAGVQTASLNLLEVDVPALDGFVELIDVPELGLR